MKKALFLDRDGVINVDKKYVHKIEDFEFCEGIFKLCRIFTQKNYLIFVITNQSGIARGYYGEKDFATLSAFMCEEFAKKGILINKIYHCPHLEGCECRKPKPGMFLKAYEEFDIDRENSFFIGDNLTDMQAGLKAGLKKLYLINSTQNGDFYQNYTNLNALLKDIEKGEICV
ncbi:D-glycero-alpha-D-manno-heptose-1,7-bisphosphate 7-phosphatase [Campylobacter helveticus]|uniref:D-glycero-alpha-D-manno-heptose-1,7-bisphosphate 7-phosphatase n=1 Tax=Campylobacter helveticus TaxID=28898 RepID=UPI0022EB1E5A|nr:HAD family hydrolase [Campylobacter helveticus]